MNGTYENDDNNNSQISNNKCSSGNGIYITTDDCTKSGGSYVSGLCPNDPANIKRCNKNCSYNDIIGECKFLMNVIGMFIQDYVQEIITLNVALH